MSKKYNKYFQRSINTGLFWYQYRFDKNLIDPVTPDIADCLSKSLVTHPPENAAFELQNYKYSMIALLIPFTLALIVLQYETFRSERVQNPVFRIGLRRRRKSHRILHRFSIAQIRK